MADEEKNIDDLNTDQDESTEDSTETTDDQDDSTEEKSTDEDESTEDSEDQDEDDAEYLKSLGVEGYDSVEAYIKDAKELKERVKVLEAENTLSKRQDKQPDKKTDDEAVNELLLSSGNASKFVDDMLKKGSIKADNADYFRSVAQIVDGAMEKNVERANQVTSFLANHMTKIIEHLRQSSWTSFPHKNLVNKSQLDPVMDKLGLIDYNDAALTYALDSDKSLLAKLTQPGKDNGKGKKFRRSTSGKRSSSPRITSSGKIYEKYLGPGGIDPDKMRGMTSDQKLKIINAFKADLDKARRAGVG